ncbi:alpha/beta hydrolase [Luteimonas sp. SX5]|uniref:Alpha/beta hydrolase n=1 Tax=Luteimonas galliterrae TaxID=2940486 RepID=A0ABT0MI76_9GAMM|nr:alpha/beta hydrolase [Luteimonas galliterrae]MCL1634574.1 alpha/beta hydrolase [Luteimonas galliterrae]
MKAIGWSLLLVIACAAPALAGAQAPASVPIIEHYPGGDRQPMQARIFKPRDGDTPSPHAAIVLFHGGGWNEGEASWMDSSAAAWASEGLVAIAVDYRLSDQKSITPYQAVADARAAMRWVRRQAARLNIDPKRIAAAGTSAGGHLAASAAIFDDASDGAVPARPDALVLRSPALSIADSGWFRKLTGSDERAAALSPDRHVRTGLPPTLVLQGEKDNVTPAAGARTFCERMRKAGNRCDLQIYPGVGHLFTRNLAQQEIPDYPSIDEAVSRDAKAKAVAFLRELGFIGR